MITVTANSYAIFGNHIYVTIYGLGQPIEYRARNILDARSFIERVLAGQSGKVDWQGDVGLNFVYHRNGD